MAKRKKIRRRRKGTSKLYFDENTQAAIAEFKVADDLAERHALYTEKIMPAFDKLCENLIFIYGFASPRDPYETLKNDCVSFLYEKIDKWDPDRGTKAFSYFNVVAKNWLIGNSNKVRKLRRRNTSLADTALMSKPDREALLRYDVAPAPDEAMLKELFKKEVLTLMHEIKTRVTGENELQCINAIITVFESVDDLDFLNKRAVFVYIRDISGLTPKQLSVALSIIRKHYRGLARNGEFSIF